MRYFAIKSTEYHANTPDTFLMDQEGNYYGVQDPFSYARARNYPKDVDYWRTATCSDADRFFTVSEISITKADALAFDQVTKRAAEVSESIPVCPFKLDDIPLQGRGKKASDKRFAEYWEKYNAWSQANGIREKVMESRRLDCERRTMFYTFLKIPHNPCN